MAPGELVDPNYVGKTVLTMMRAISLGLGTGEELDLTGTTGGGC